MKTKLFKNITNALLIISLATVWVGIPIYAVVDGRSISAYDGH